MTNKSETHGGVRTGAGRNKRGEAERWRVKLWYETISEALAGERVSGRTLGDIIINTGERHRLAPNIQKALGSQEAWRWYQNGDRTPKSTTITSVDRLLKKEEHPPVGWILTPAGKMQLTPIWLWSTTNCGLSNDEIGPCREMEKLFWDRLPGDGSLVEEAARCQVINDAYFRNVESPLEFEWPPRILVPKDIAKKFPKDPGAPFPHIFPSKDSIRNDRPEEDDGLYYTEKELMEIYRRWAESPVAEKEDGEEWFYNLRYLPGSPFYEPETASLEASALKTMRRRRLENEIRDHFGIPKNNSPII